MTKREVKQPLVSYRDDEGLLHHALQGTHVDVGESFLKEFDALNDPKEEEKPAAKKAAPRKTGRDGR